MKEHPHYENPSHDRAGQLNNYDDVFKPQKIGEFRNSREVVHAFIDGQITIDQLNEALRRDSERIIHPVGVPEEVIVSDQGKTNKTKLNDTPDEQTSEQEKKDKKVIDYIRGFILESEKYFMGIKGL